MPSRSAFPCPLCGRLVEPVLDPKPFGSNYKIPNHPFQGKQGDLIDRLHCVQWEVQCPLSGMPASRQGEHRG